jgi:hypothetical protein
MIWIAISTLKVNCYIPEITIVSLISFIIGCIVRLMFLPSSSENSILIISSKFRLFLTYPSIAFLKAQSIGEIYPCFGRPMTHDIFRNISEKS